MVEDTNHSKNSIGVFVSSAPPYNVGFDMHFTKLSPNQFITFNIKRGGGGGGGGGVKIAVFARMYWARQIFLFPCALSTIIFASIVDL
jgi:hypothetical protein